MFFFEKSDHGDPVEKGDLGKKGKEKVTEEEPECVNGKQIEDNPLEIIETSERLPALQVDVQQFQSYLDDLDISEESKIELLETLWSIVVTFVDMGFGIHPVQQVMEEQLLDRAEKKAKETEKNGR